MLETGTALSSGIFLPELNAVPTPEQSAGLSDQP